MKLQKAFEMSVEYLGHADPIRVDKRGYICLTDMAKFFPRKRLDVWMKSASTKEFIDTVDKFLNTTERCDLESTGGITGTDGVTYVIPPIE